MAPSRTWTCLPTLVSFAVTTDKIANIVSPEFKGAGHKVVWLCPEYGPDGLPVAASLKQVYQTVGRLMKKGKILAAYTPGFGGVAEAVLKMSLGNGVGLKFDDGCTMDELFAILTAPLSWSWRARMRWACPWAPPPKQAT